MKSNRMFDKGELAAPEYAAFFAEFTATIPRDVQIGMRTWEHYAALEGVDWSGIKSVLDVGSFCSTTPFYLKSRVAEVLTCDNYEWLDVRQLPTYQYDRDQWERRLLELGIQSIGADISTLTLSEPVDLVVCVSTLEHIPDYLRAIDNMLRLAPRLIITTDAHATGIPYENFGRFFSKDQLREIADRMGVGLDTAGGDEMYLGNRTLAVIRKP